MTPRYRKIPEDSRDDKKHVSIEDKSDEDNSTYSSKHESKNDDSDEEGEFSSSSSSSSRKSLDASDSDTEVRHGNRSWKLQRQSEIPIGDNYLNSDEKQSSDNELSNQSPQFELIGQVSQLGDGCVKNSQNSATPTGEAISSCDRNEKEQYLSNSENDKDTNNFEQVENIIATEKSISSVTCILPAENVCLKGVEIIENITKTEPETVLLAENKRKECVETGSLLDLKSRRSKRYSSADNLSIKKSQKSRRKSLSMHDLASMCIAEKVTARRNSLSTCEQISPGLISDKLPSTSHEDPLTSEISLEIALPIEDDTKETYKNILPDTQISESSLNNDISSMETDSGNDLFPQLPLATDFSKPFQQIGSLPDYLKKQKKLVNTRFSCTLQNISEEMSAENSSLMHYIEEGRKSLRRSLRKSLSSEQLAECDFVRDNLLPRSNSSSALPSREEIKKPFSLEGIKEDILNSKELAENDSSIQITKNKELNLELDNVAEANSSMSTVYLTDHKSNVCSAIETDAYFADLNVSESKTRRTRASSEPLVSDETLEFTALSKKRKSYSSLKVESIHKRLLSRPSRRRSTMESLYNSLEIVDSDESFKESQSRISRQRKSKKSVPEDIDAKDNNMSVQPNEQLLEEVKPSTLNENVSVNKHDGPSDGNIISSDYISMDPSTSSRLSRATSEPPSYFINEGTSKHNRRSSSLLKINKRYNFIIARNNLRKSRSSHCFTDLDIVNSSSEDKSLTDVGIARITSDDDMDDAIAPHVVIKKRSADEVKVNKETYLSKPDDEDVVKEDNGSSKRQCSKNQVTDLTTDSTIHYQGVEENEPSDFESMIVSHEVLKKLKKSDLIPKKSATKGRENLRKVRVKKDVKDVSKGNSSISQQPPKKSGRRNKSLKPIDDVINEQEEMQVEYNDQPKEIVLPKYIQDDVNSDTQLKRKQANDSEAPKSKKNRPVKKKDTGNKGKGTKKSSNKRSSFDNKLVSESKDCGKKAQITSDKALPSKKTVKKGKDKFGGKNEQVVKDNKNIDAVENSAVSNDEVNIVQSQLQQTEVVSDHRTKGKQTSKKAKSKKDDVKTDVISEPIKEGDESESDKSTKPKKKKGQFGVDDILKIDDHNNKNKLEVTGQKGTATKKSLRKKAVDLEVDISQSQPPVVDPKIRHGTTNVKSKDEKDEHISIVAPETAMEESQVHLSETPVKLKPKKRKEKIVDLDQSILDSPARHTRRSVSIMSDTELIGSPGILGASKQSQRTRAMSDIVLSSPLKADYAESEASEAASTSSRLATPTRRSARLSHSNPGTPDLKAEDYLVHRRLTRNQHQQMQKSFETSLMETPRPTRLEDLPEEVGETDNNSTPSETSNHTPVRSSARNSNRRPLNYSLSKPNKATPKK